MTEIEKDAMRYLWLRETNLMPLMQKWLKGKSFLSESKSGKLMLPKRIPKAPKRKSRWRSPAHRAWVRSHACCACGSMQNIECAHVRLGTDGGMGFKPSDEWCISLCSHCHHMSHNVGEATFARDNKIDLKALAQEFIKQSPHRHKLRQHNDGRTKPSWKKNWEVDDN